MGRPRWGRILAGILVILVLGVPCLIGAVAISVGGNYHLRKNPAADGRAPGSLTFTAEKTRYVVALSAKPDGFFDGLTRTERRRKFRVRESDASEARCVVAHADGTTSRLRGDRQNLSQVVGNVYATVGEFDGRGGPTALTCRFDPPRDLLGTVTETPLMVHEASNALRYLGIGLFVGVFVIAGLGTMLILWGTVWRDRSFLGRRRGPTTTA